MDGWDWIETAAVAGALGMGCRINFTGREYGVSNCRLGRGAVYSSSVAKGKMFIYF